MAHVNDTNTQVWNIVHLDFMCTSYNSSDELNHKDAFV